MRIGYLTYGLDRAPTGIGRYAVQVLQALAAQRNKHEIVLLTTEREDQHGLWHQFEHHALQGCSLLPALMTLGNVRLIDAARRYRLDVVHDPNGIAPFLGPRMNARRVVTIYDAFAFVHPEVHNRLDNLRYRWHLPIATQRVDAIMTVSQCSRRDLARFLGFDAARLHTIPAGVDAHFKVLPDDAYRQATLRRYGITKPYLLYVGGINARKNIARLFEAYAQVRQQHPNLALVIGGKRQWQTSEIDATLQRLELAPHIHFTGYVDDADLPALYNGAEVFVFPSLYEGFGLPPLEAMACGTPVITSNISSLPEVVGDAALTIDPYDVNALAAAILQVLSSRSLHTELRERGLARASQFTWERTASETLAVYEHVLVNASRSIRQQHSKL